MWLARPDENPRYTESIESREERKPGADMSSTTHGATPYYFVPGPSAYPVSAAIGLFFVILGAAQWINGHEWGAWSLLIGMVAWLGTLFVWFRPAIGESESGQYGHKIDLSFR